MEAGELPPPPGYAAFSRAAPCAMPCAMPEARPEARRIEMGGGCAWSR